MNVTFCSENMHLKHSGKLISQLFDHNYFFNIFIKELLHIPGNTWSTRFFFFTQHGRIHVTAFANSHRKKNHTEINMWAIFSLLFRTETSIYHRNGQSMCPIGKCTIAACGTWPQWPSNESEAECESGRCSVCSQGEKWSLTKTDCS